MMTGAVVRHGTTWESFKQKDRKVYTRRRESLAKIYTKQEGSKDLLQMYTTVQVQDDTVIFVTRLRLRVSVTRTNWRNLTTRSA